MKSFFSAIFTVYLVGGVALADIETGTDIFEKCKPYHPVGEGARHHVGPQLSGIFSRRAGSREDMGYSENTMRGGAKGSILTGAILDAFIENLRAPVPKTSMNFTEIIDANGRAPLVPYLYSFSGDTIDNSDAETRPDRTNFDLDPAIFALQGDPEYGEYLAGACKTCHQTSGATDGIPGISGRPTEEFVVAMQAYKQKLRPNPVMQMMAARLSDEEIAALAEYFKNLE